MGRGRRPAAYVVGHWGDSTPAGRADAYALLLPALAPFLGPRDAALAALDAWARDGGAALRARPRRAEPWDVRAAVRVYKRKGAKRAPPR